jgi:hypothetical protein
MNKAQLFDRLFSITLRQLYRPRKKVYDVSIGRLEVTADTPEQAVEGVIDRVKIALEGTYTPLLIAHRGDAYLIWREPTLKWCYGPLDRSNGPHAQKGRILCVGYESREEVERVVRRHLASNVWDGEEETSTLILNQEDQDRFGEDCRWQKRYKMYKSQGMSDNEAHHAASGRHLNVLQDKDQ